MSLDRRSFLGLGAVALAGAVAPPLRAATDPYLRWRGKIVVNALGSLGNPNVRDPDEDTSGIAESRRKRFSIDAREFDDLRASGLTAVNCTLGHVAGPGDPFERTISEIALYDRLVQDRPDAVIKVLRAADIGRAQAGRKVGLIYGFQNTTMLGDKLERIDVFADSSACA